MQTCFVVRLTTGPELDSHCPLLHTHPEALGKLEFYSICVSHCWKNQMWPRESVIRTRPTDRSCYLLVTSPPPTPCLEGCRVWLNQRKWILDIWALEEVCVCLNTALFKGLLCCLILIVRTVLVAGTSLTPGSRRHRAWQGTRPEPSM